MSSAQVDIVVKLKIGTKQFELAKGEAESLFNALKELFPLKADCQSCMYNPNSPWHIRTIPNTQPVVTWTTCNEAGNDTNSNT